MRFDTANTPFVGAVFAEPFRIYTGLLGQIGDIIMFSATVRRIRELFPNSTITFAVSAQYREAGELVAGLPYVDRLFVTERYFETLTDRRRHAWECGWPYDLRGDDEVVEQRRHDIILETRPQHRRHPWYKYAHQVEELAHMVGVPGPICRQTEIRIPDGVAAPPEARGKIVFHNDPNIDATKAWPEENVKEFLSRVGPENVVVLGSSGPPLPGTLDLRGRTTLAEAAAIIAACRCYVGIDSGLMWIAASLQVPVVGLYGTSYIPAYGAIQPENPNAAYLQVHGTLDSICARTVVATVDRQQRARRNSG